MGKILIYQLLPRLFGNKTPRTSLVQNGTKEQNGVGKLNDINSQVLSRIKKRGFSHIWLTGILRHATTTDYTRYGIPRQHPSIVKGKAGSPYAICDYYDIDPDLTGRPTQRMKDFERLLYRAHKAGLGVVIDFVPNHLARQYKSIAHPKGVTDMGCGDDTSKHFSPQNSFYYYPGESFSPQFSIDDETEGRYEEMPAKATGNDCFTPSPGINDWYETVKLNYGIDYTAYGGPQKHFNPTPITWKKMKRVLTFWAAKGVDAFRCDMAEMVPPEFWDYAIGALKKDYPEIKFIAEVYNPSLYQRYLDAGFDWLYDKVGMYDTLRAVTTGQCNTEAITRQWQSAETTRSSFLYFMENHDEQRIASDFFAGEGRKGIPAAAVSMLMSTNPFMMYAGQEFGERGMDEEGFSGRDGRTTIFDYWAVSSIQRGFYYRAQMTAEEKALEETYINLTNTAATQKAITDGLFFDLMYVNPTSGKFNAERMYTFLRSYDNQTLLITANFSNESRDIEVKIPDHAFKVLGIKPQNNCYASDLIDPHNRVGMYNPRSVNFHIEPYGVSILSLHYSGNLLHRNSYNAQR